MAAAALMYSQAHHPSFYGGQYNYPAFNAQPDYQSINFPANNHAVPRSRLSRKRHFDSLETESDEHVQHKRRELEIPTNVQPAQTVNVEMPDAMMDDENSHLADQSAESSHNDSGSDSESDSTLIGRSQSLVPMVPIRSMKEQMLQWMREDHKREMQQRLDEMGRNRDESNTDDSDKQLVLYQPIIPPSVLANLSNDNAMADSM